MAAAGNQWTSTVIGLLAIVIALFFALSVGAFPANHPGADDGRVLLGELNCVACHDAGEIAGINWRQGPGLGEAGAQLKPEWLRLRLNSDLHGIMPDVLHGMPRAERAATVEDIVQFLASRGTLEAEVSAEPKDVKAGRNLYHTVGCVACHQPFELPATFFPKGSDAAAEDTVLPKLDSYSLTLYPQSRRTTTAKLAEFLAAPLYTHSSGRMPDLGLSADESRQIAAYLTSQEAPALPQEAATEFVADAAAAVRGAERFTALGCANCHTTEVNEPPAKLDLKALAATAKAFAAADSRSPGGEGPEKAIDNDPKTKYLNFGKLGSGLLITLPRQAVLSAITITSANDSPDRDPSAFKLEGSNDGETFAFITELGLQPFKDRFESQHISFRNTRAFTSYRFTVTKLRGNGLMQFAELQLFASRPPIPGVASTMTARPLAALNMNAKDGCLSAAPAAGRPRYVFTDIQRNAIRNAVATGKAGSPRQRVAETMRSFNCTACHERDGRRPDADRARYFTTTTAVDLGLEGRIPPSLTGVGSKLTEKGLGMLLLEGHRLRPHMATRMPRFGADNVGHLTTVFSQADGDGAAASEVALDRQTIKNGRGLVGVKGLACVNCHAWGGSKSLGVPGPDLVETVKRLEFDWFHRWLSNPLKMHPGTRMPNFWPDGKSGITAIHGGARDLQIAAIWAYLIAGEKGGAPIGVSRGGEDDGSLLRPADTPIVFRTFLRGVSAHAVLVGFKEQSNMVFDSNRVRTVSMWSGDFIGTAGTWGGRAGQYAKLPSDDVIATPAGPPFAELASLSSEWPKDREKAKKGASRTPEGWRFRGYRYDSERSPIFLYDIGGAEVSEAPEGLVYIGGVSLTRRFRITGNRSNTLYFIAARAPEISKAGGAWKVGDRQLITLKADGKPIVRELAGNKELLLPIPQGTAFTFEIEVAW